MNLNFDSVSDIQKANCKLLCIKIFLGCPPNADFRVIEKENLHKWAEVRKFIGSNSNKQEPFQLSAHNKGPK